MATKKKVSKKKALVSVDAMKKRLAERREAKGSILGEATGDWIAVKGKKFQWRGTELDAPVGVVVVSYAHENAYYDGVFDPDNPQPPACCAIGIVRSEELVPLEESPKVQAEQCFGCEHNEFGSDARGRGKRCKNQYRVALLPSDDPTGDLAFIRVSPTGLKQFESFIRKAEMQASHPVGVYATMDFDADEEYERVIFESDSEIEDAETLQQFIDRMDEADERIVEPGYAFDTYEERPQRKRTAKRKVQSKKKVIAKKKKLGSRR